MRERETYDGSVKMEMEMNVPGPEGGVDSGKNGDEVRV